MSMVPYLESEIGVGMTLLAAAAALIRCKLPGS